MAYSKDPINISHDDGFDHLRRRNRMNVLVAIATLAGVAALVVLFVYAKHRTVHAEHYEFRRVARPGADEQDIIEAFGRPYRVYWTRKSAMAALSGRGAYSRFDRDMSSPQAFPANFARVLHYRPTTLHGEYVFISEDGEVLLVVTGHRVGAQ